MTTVCTARSIQAKTVKQSLSIAGMDCEAFSPAVQEATRKGYALTVELPPEDVLITLATKCGGRRRRLAAGVDLNVLVTKIMSEADAKGGATVRGVSLTALPTILHYPMIHLHIQKTLHTFMLTVLPSHTPGGPGAEDEAARHQQLDQEHPSRGV